MFRVHIVYTQGKEHSESAPRFLGAFKSYEEAIICKKDFLKRHPHCADESMYVSEDPLERERYRDSTELIYIDDTTLY